jgi:hypothetical protein
MSPTAFNILKALKLTSLIQEYQNNSGVMGLTVHETPCEYGCTLASLKFLVDWLHVIILMAVFICIHYSWGDNSEYLSRWQHLFPSQ